MDKLKELLKPPFVFYDDRMLFNTKDRRYFIKRLFTCDMVNSSVEEMIAIETFITAALNEKWERDFSEPLKWIFEYNEEDGEYWVTCPKCKKTDMYSDDNDPPDLREQKYCCHCSQRLDPPQGDVL